VSAKQKVRTPDEFPRLANDLRVVANLLNDYLRESDVDVPGTKAADEYLRQSEFADDQLVDPVLHVTVRAQHSLTAAIDHLLGAAACIEAENVVFSVLTLLRPAVTAAGTTYYLMDPAIDVRERLRRGWNLELDSVREQLNSLDKESMPEAWEQTAITRNRYLVWGRHHGYGQEKRNDRFGQPKYWLTDGDNRRPPLTDMKLAEEVLAAVGDGQMGRTVYRFTSSFIHTQAHAFTFFLPSEIQFDPETPNVAPLGVTVEDLTTWIMVATLAVHTAAARCSHYFGWNMTDWVRVVHPIMSGWASVMRSASVF